MCSCPPDARQSDTVCGSPGGERMYQKVYWRGYFRGQGTGDRGRGSFGQRLHEVEGAGARDRLKAALYPELAQDVVDMALDRADCHD